MDPGTLLRIAFCPPSPRDTTRKEVGNDDAIHDQDHLQGAGNDTEGDPGSLRIGGGRLPGPRARASKTPSGGPGRSSSHRHQRPGLGGGLGPEHMLYQRCRAGELRLAISPELLAELGRVLRSNQDINRVTHRCREAVQDLVPQLRLFALVDAGWLKALKLEGYAPRRPRAPWALQEVLFSYLEAL
jgi:hypothetical protein